MESKIDDFQKQSTIPGVFAHAPNWSFNQRPLLLPSGPPPSWRCSQLQRSRLKGGERFLDFGDLGQDGTPPPKKHVEMVMVHIF